MNSRRKTTLSNQCDHSILNFIFLTSISNLHEFIFEYLLFYVYGCCIYMYVCVPCTRRPEDSTRSTGPGAIDGYEPSHKFWESKLGSLEEQHLTSEPPFKPHMNLLN